MNPHRILTILIQSVACAGATGTTPPLPDLRPGSIGIAGSAADTVTIPIPLIVLGGGSTDQDAAMRRFVNAASGGDVGVIRASGSTGYTAYLFDLGRVHSVETFLLASREAASIPVTQTLLSQVEALFVAGGDQWNYVVHWSGSPLDATIRALKDVKRIPFGGTSAGAMIWGGRIFDAAKGSVTSAEALADPFDTKVSLRPGLFGSAPILQPYLIDTHFSERNREGRLMVFLARSIESGYLPKGLGIDERTALVIDADGIGTVHGSGFVWVYAPVSADSGPEVMLRGQPFTWNRSGRAVRVWKLANSERFDMARIQPLDRPASFYASVVGGVFFIIADNE